MSHEVKHRKGRKVYHATHSLIHTLYYGVIAAEAHGFHGALAVVLVGLCVAGFFLYHEEEV